MLTILIIITALALIGIIVYDLIEKRKEMRDKERTAKEAEMARLVSDEQRRRKKINNLIKQAKSEYETALGNLISTYGDCSFEILLNSRSFKTSDHVYFFEQGAMMVLNDEPIPFEKIIGFSLNDAAETLMKNETTSYTSTTSTSNANMLKRAVVGGIFMGGIGALAGATTAKQQTISTPSLDQTTTTIEHRHKYSLYINIDSISNPTRVIELGADIQKATNFANILNVIIQRNKK